MSMSFDIDRVKVLSRAFDSWVVEFRIPVTELLDHQRLLLHLRSVKQYLSSTQSVPENCLLFDGIVRKSHDDEFVDVVVRIKKMMVMSGAPRIVFTSEEITTDVCYSNMHAFLDIYYLDEFANIITHDRVMRAIRSAGVMLDLVDSELVASSVTEVIETQTASKNIPIAHGTLPGMGKDAEVEFFFQAVGDSTDVDLIYSTRRVKKGDLLCRKLSPEDSAIEGLNVLGHKLPPRQGFDIILSAGTNAVLSIDGMDVVAEKDGIAVVTRVSRRIRVGRTFREIPGSISVKIDPILKIDASELSELSTSHAVEITGNLRVGTKILSESEVFVSGDVEAGASITASDDILVKGRVTGAILSSQGNITTQEGVESSELHSQGEITIGGAVTNSTLEGNAVRAKSASGSRIVARKSVTLDSVDEDEGKMLTTICVGMNEFFMQRLRENQKFLETAYSNLERIKLVVGEQIFYSVTPSNTHTMLMKLLTRLRYSTNSQGRKQVDVYRQLIDTIAPTRAIIEQKEQECRNIAERMATPAVQSESIIVVKERIASRTIANVDGVKGMVDASRSGVSVKVKDGELSVTSQQGQNNEH